MKRIKQAASSEYKNGRIQERNCYSFFHAVWIRWPEKFAEVESKFLETCFLLSVLSSHISPAAFNNHNQFNFTYINSLYTTFVKLRSHWCFVNKSHGLELPQESCKYITKQNYWKPIDQMPYQDSSGYGLDSWLACV